MRFTYRFIYGDQYVDFERIYNAPEDGFLELIRGEYVLMPWVRGLSETLLYNSQHLEASSGAGGEYDEAGEMFLLFSHLLLTPASSSPSTPPSAPPLTPLRPPATREQVAEFLHYLTRQSSVNITGGYTVHVFQHPPREEDDAHSQRTQEDGLVDLLEAHHLAGGSSPLSHSVMGIDVDFDDTGSVSSEMTQDTHPDSYS